MILRTPQFEATFDWLLSMYRQTGANPSEILCDLLKNNCSAVAPALLDRAPFYVTDMLALELLDRAVVVAAAHQIAQQRTPQERATAIEKAQAETDSVDLREPSAVVRMLEGRGYNPTTILEALVASGTISTKQIQAAAEPAQ